jgi:hypothetical protein
LLSAKCLPLYLTKVPSPLQNLKEIGVTSTSARSDYVAIGPDGRKLTSSTGIGIWKHKDSKAKTHYSFNELNWYYYQLGCLDYNRLNWCVLLLHRLLMLDWVWW